MKFTLASIVLVMLGVLPAAQAVCCYFCDAITPSNITYAFPGAVPEGLTGVKTMYGSLAEAEAAEAKAKMSPDECCGPVCCCSAKTCPGTCP